MKDLLQKANKNGVSLMVSYVLLIVIGISLAIMVYYWVLPQINMEESPKCPDDTALIIYNYECDSSAYKVNITVKNQGKFTIDGFFIRGANETGDVVPGTALIYAGQIEQGRYDFGKSLNPGETNKASFSYSDLGRLNKLQIEPFRFQEDKKGKEMLVLCKQAGISQEVIGCEQ